jgi:hypothetical protein
MGFVVNAPLWRDATVPFEIDPEIQAFYGSPAFAAANPGVRVESTRMIEEAVARWNAAASIKLRPRQGESHYLNLKRGPKGNGGHTGATSSGEAVITFDFEWSLGTGWKVAVRSMMHEIGHAVGLIHEHQRPDRETYIGFNVPTATNGDLKLVTGGTQVGAYDCVSIMHYIPRGTPPDFFSRPGGCPRFGDAEDTNLSAGDIAALQFLYPPKLLLAMSPTGAPNQAKTYVFSVTRADNGQAVAGAQLSLRNGTANHAPQMTTMATDGQGHASRSLTLRSIRKITAAGRQREVEIQAPTLEASKAGFVKVAMALLPDV